jgi:hypothetical protein
MGSQFSSVGIVCTDVISNIESNIKTDLEKPHIYIHTYSYTNISIF